MYAKDVAQLANRIYLDVRRPETTILVLQLRAF